MVRVHCDPPPFLYEKVRAYLDNCTAREKIQERPVANYGSSGNKEEGQMKIWTEPHNWSQDHRNRVETHDVDEIKLQRAQGGCPGTIRRRRTWKAAISYGEPQAGIDP